MMLIMLIRVVSQAAILSCVEPNDFALIRVAQHACQIFETHPGGVFGLAVRIAFDAEGTGDLLQDIVMNEFVHALFFASEPIINRGDRAKHLAEDAGFLMDFALRRLLRGFPLFDMPLWQAPLQMPAARMPRDNRNLIALVENQTACGILAHDRQIMRIKRSERHRRFRVETLLRHHRRARHCRLAIIFAQRFCQGFGQLVCKGCAETRGLRREQRLRVRTLHATRMACALALSAGFLNLLRRYSDPTKHACYIIWGRHALYFTQTDVQVG